MSQISPVMMILIVVLIAAIGVAVWMYVQKSRTQKLRSQFGPEYDKAIDQSANRHRAEAELQDRVKRVAKFSIHPLSPEDRARFIEAWRTEQSLFVDNPRLAVNHADALVQEVMKRRGYPVSDFDQNAADLSVDHPTVVENYRIAHEIAVRDSKTPANTEDLRRALVSYRTLFEDLLGGRVSENAHNMETPEEVRR